MNQERLMKVILAPVISEKATLVGETRKQVVFEVLQDATKAEIKAAVELLFKEQKVQVGAVKRSVLQWRFIDGVAAKIDEPALREVQQRKDAVAAYELVYAALGA